MKQDNIWALIESITYNEFLVKNGTTNIVDSSHVCVIQINKIGLKDGVYIIEGKGAKAKPVKSKGEAFSPNMPEIEFPLTAKLGTTENIYKILTQMGGLVTLRANPNKQSMEISYTSGGYIEIDAPFPTTKIVGEDKIISHFDTRYLQLPFRYLNPTTLSFGENFPILIEGENWKFFLAPRND